MVSIVQQAEDPDYLARQAGRQRYDSKVGDLRRHELHRLGNAWGMNFPAGATKEFMLPYFRQLEAEGKDPIQDRPNRTIPLRPTFSETESHVEPLTHDDAGQPLNGAAHVNGGGDETAPAGDLRARIEALDHGKLKKLVKELGLPQSNKDRRGDLIDRVLEHQVGHAH